MRKQSIPALSAIYLGSLFLSGTLLGAQQPSASSSQILEEPTAVAVSTGGALPAIDPPAAKPALKATVPLQSVLDSLSEMLDDYRKSGNRHEQANTLSAIANTYSLLHQQQRSLDFYNSALAVWTEIDDKQGQAITLSNMGDIYREWGFPDRAAHYYRESLAIYAKAPNRTREAATLNDLGVVYLSLRDKKKALDYLNLALVADRNIHDRLAEARTISNLGAAYYLLSADREKALDSLQDAETRMEVLGDSDDEANTLEIIGLVWRSLKKPEIASTTLQRALMLFRKIGNTQGEQSVLKQLRDLGGSPPRQE